MTYGCGGPSRAGGTNGNHNNFDSGNRGNGRASGERFDNEEDANDIADPAPSNGNGDKFASRGANEPASGPQAWSDASSDTSSDASEDVSADVWDDPIKTFHGGPQTWNGVPEDVSDDAADSVDGGGNRYHGCGPGSSHESEDSSFGDDGTEATDGSGVTGGSGGSFNAGANPGLDRWKGGIDNAAAISGLEPNLIGGQIWAESRGDNGTGTTNIDGTADIGLMQISQERFDRDVLPNLDDATRSKIRELTGKDASGLDMSNPEDNIIGGSLELKQWIRNTGSLEAGLNGYVSGEIEGVGSPTYVSDVLEFQSTLDSGGALRD